MRRKSGFGVSNGSKSTKKAPIFSPKGSSNTNSFTNNTSSTPLPLNNLNPSFSSLSSTPSNMTPSTPLLISSKRRNPFGEADNNKRSTRQKIDKISPFDMSSLMVIMKNATSQSGNGQQNNVNHIKCEEDKENYHSNRHSSSFNSTHSKGTCHICVNSLNKSTFHHQTPFGNKENYCSPCDFCDKSTCSSCLKRCEKCNNYFCGICSTSNYDQRYERTFCLSCNTSEIQFIQASVVRSFTKCSSKSSSNHLFPLNINC